MHPRPRQSRHYGCPQGNASNALREPEIRKVTASARLSVDTPVALHIHHMMWRSRSPICSTFLAGWSRRSRNKAAIPSCKGLVVIGIFVTQSGVRGIEHPYSEKDCKTGEHTLCLSAWVLQFQRVGLVLHDSFLGRAHRSLGGPTDNRKGSWGKAN